jgi:hypothetical protein
MENFRINSHQKDNLHHFVRSEIKLSRRTTFKQTITMYIRCYIRKKIVRGESAQSACCLALWAAFARLDLCWLVHDGYKAKTLISIDPQE